jgi:hypothetical protein
MGKVSTLPVATTWTNEDIIYLIQAGVSKQIILGLLLHEQNSDTALAASTENEVTAEEIRNFIDAGLKWEKTTINFNDVTAIGSFTTGNIVGASLPAGGFIHGVKIKHSESFSGGAITNTKISIGIATDVDKYASLFDIFQSVSGTTGYASECFFTESHTDATDIIFYFESTSDDLSSLTQGVVEVWLLVSKAI